MVVNTIEVHLAMREVERAWFNPNRRRTGHTTRLVERARELLDTATVESPVVIVSQCYRNLDRIIQLIGVENKNLVRLVATKDKGWRRVFTGLRSVEAVLVDNY